MTGLMEKVNPLISVIVPIYKAEKYLVNCIKSIIEQTYQNLEIVLVDDGSPDSCPQICDEYAKKDSRIIVIHKENGGVSSARNAGIDICHGTYITFLDADDELKSTYIEVLWKNLVDNEADVSCCRPTHHNYQWNMDNSALVWNREESLVQSLSDHPLTHAAWAKLYTREIIGNLRFDTSLRINEDSFFVFQICCKQPRLIAVADNLYIYNFSTSSTSRSNFSEKFNDILIVSQRKYEIIKNSFPHLIDLAKNMLLKAKMNYLQNICLKTDGEYSDTEKSLIQEIKKEKKHYIPSTKADDKWHFIICHNLYFIYKRAYRIKSRKARK